MFALWTRLDVIELSEQLHREGKASWFTSITKIAEITNIGNEFNDKIRIENKNKIQNILNKNWFLKRNEYRQGKLRLYTQLKERPGSENYLNLSNPKLRQAITKLRISAHRFPIETGRFENKPLTERICPLCCEDIGDICHYLTQCTNEEMKNVRSKLLKLFKLKWRGIEKLSKDQLCKAILSCQNEDILIEIGLLCHKIIETFELLAL